LRVEWKLSERGPLPVMPKSRGDKGKEGRGGEEKMIDLLIQTFARISLQASWLLNSLYEHRRTASQDERRCQREDERKEKEKPYNRSKKNWEKENQVMKGKHLVLIDMQQDERKSN